MNDKQIFIIITSVSANLCSALENIKSDCPENAVVTLERALDRCVVCLGAMRGKMQKADDEALVVTLKAVRSYRHRHPCQPNLGIVGAALNEEHQIAQKILQELEK